MFKDSVPLVELNVSLPFKPGCTEWGSRLSEQYRREKAKPGWFLGKALYDSFSDLPLNVADGEIAYVRLKPNGTIKLRFDGSYGIWKQVYEPQLSATPKERPVYYMHGTFDSLADITAPEREHAIAFVKDESGNTHMYVYIDGKWEITMGLGGLAS